MVHKKHALTSLIALPAIALVVAGCGGGGSVAAVKAPSKSASNTSSSTAALMVASKANVGRVLVDARGRTLYRYTPDHAGKSTCMGTCAQSWPPATATGSGPFTATGIKGTVASLTRPGGVKQLTLNGMPLYRFAGDASTADANGQGVGHIWFVIPAKTGAGTSQSAAVSPAGTPSPKPTSSNGY
jgi:predicted lipoprotein with Yx(FWY)xxD motif